MTPPADADNHDPLARWLQTTGSKRARRQHTRPAPGRMRFAFYGRISTAEYQDPVSSRQSQYDNAARLIEGHGQIVAEFFDVGHSRSLAWTHRPSAAALLVPCHAALNG